MEEVIQTSGNINIGISYYPAIGKYDKLHLDAIDLGYKLISVVINIMDCIFSCIAHHNFSYYWSSTIVVLAMYTHATIMITVIIMFGIKMHEIVLLLVRICLNVCFGGFCSRGRVDFVYI